MSDSNGTHGTAEVLRDMGLRVNVLDEPEGASTIPPRVANTRAPNDIPKPHRILASEMSAQQRNALLDGLVAQVVTLTREANADRLRLDKLHAAQRETHPPGTSVVTVCYDIQTDTFGLANPDTVQAVCSAFVRSYPTVMARLRWLVAGK